MHNMLCVKEHKLLSYLLNSSADNSLSSIDTYVHQPCTSAPLEWQYRFKCSLSRFLASDKSCDETV